MVYLTNEVGHLLDIYVTPDERDKNEDTSLDELKEIVKGDKLGIDEL